MNKILDSTTQFLSKKNFLLIAVAILILAAVLRLYKLGDVPHGMTWDEAAIGYNGFAVFHTRRDEWLAKLPISFKSFGDFKSPLAIYLNGPFTFLFGMNLWAVRLPFALAGILTVGGCFALGYQLAKKNFSAETAKIFGLGLAFLMAVSPWAVHFSRVGFESGLALCLIVWGVAAFVFFLDLPAAVSVKEKRIQRGALGLSILTLVASFYTYHSSKIVAPLLVLSVIFLYGTAIKLKMKFLVQGAVAAFILLLPLLKDTFFANGAERFSQATLFGQHLTFTVLVESIAAHFFAHLLPSFLMFGQTVTLRHGDGHWGVLFLTEVVLVLVSILFLIANLEHRKVVGSREMILGVFWVIIGILPAAIGTDVPHANRALLALPGFLILAIYGFYNVLHYLSQTELDKKLSGSKGENHLLVKSVAGMFLLFHMLFLFGYIHDYYTTFAKESANDFQDGFIEAFQFAVKNEATSDQIIISDKYGQAYIFALFVRKTNPIWYQGGIMVKYVYLPKINEGDLARKNTVIIATPDQISPEHADQLVYGSDGQIKFVLVKTK